MQGGCYLISYGGCYLIQGNILTEVFEAIYEFNLTFSNSSSYIDSIGDTRKVGVLEFDASALIPIIQEDVEASGREVGGYLFSGAQEGCITDVGDGDDDLVGRNGGMECVG